MSAPVGTVYFIRALGGEGLVKIGCSKTPMARVEALAAWSPVPLKIAATARGTFADERYVQNCFADAHSHGEWFRPTPKLNAFIERVATTGEISWMRDAFKPTGNTRAKSAHTAMAPAGYSPWGKFPLEARG